MLDLCDPGMPAREKRVELAGVREEGWCAQQNPPPLQWVSSSSNATETSPFRNPPRYLHAKKAGSAATRGIVSQVMVVAVVCVGVGGGEGARGGEWPH